LQANLKRCLKNPAYNFKRIGLEAGPLSQWLFGALAEAELPVVCVETRHMQAVLKTQINKTDQPAVAHAQEPAMPVIGFLSIGSPELTAPSVAAFRHAVSS
jgi:transposase